MKNIYIIPTDKYTNLFIGDLSGALHFNHSIEKGNSINQNLYITSDEVIKKGDYWIYVCPINGIDYGDDNNPIVKNNLNSTWFEKLHDKNNYKKVILTTDSDLIQDGVQAIDDEFLEWFVKNPTCKFVEVKLDGCRVNRGQCDCSEQDIDCQCLGYKIINPKEEQKQILSEMLQEDEIIEQFAIKYSNMHQDVSSTLGKYLVKAVFKDGAIWQKEQIYSKQQVLELMKQAFEAGFKKADTVEAGLEPKETEQEVNWILLKYK